MNASRHPKRPQSFDQQYASAKKRLLTIGFVAEGSLSKRYLTCGNASCRCANNPDQRHGPYYQLTWKRNGKTIAQFIPPTMAHCYEEWIQNRQLLAKILTDMYSISQKAIYSRLESMTEPAEKAALSSVKIKLRKT